MTENIHGGLRSEFLHDKCFPEITKKLTVESYYMPQNAVEMLQ